MQQIAKQAFNYLNEIRANPKIAIPPLQEKLKYFKGNVLQLPNQAVGLMTQEGPSAYNDCIKFLEKQAPLHAFIWDEGLAQAARDHANDIGPKGITGHSGSDGSSMSDRIERYGEWNGHVGENISFGQKSGIEVILQLIVDDGVPSKGHRNNCFKNDFNLVGVAAAIHKQYKDTCVFDFAEEFTSSDQIQGQKNNQGVQKKPQAQQPQYQQQNQGRYQYPDQSQDQTNHIDNDDPNMPPNCVKMHSETQTTIKNGKKQVVVKKTYEMADGSTKSVTETTMQG